MSAATPPEVRAARAFLIRKGIRPGEVSPRKFANSAKELNMSFVKVLRLISRLYSGGQGQQQFRLEVIAAEAAKEAG